jgi:hypothetical protein
MKILILVLSFITTFKSFAHGEDKLGPHGGYIQMPGTFHTEVVPGSDVSYVVYLLDIKFQNPVIKDSYVKLRIEHNQQTINFKCPSMGNHFHCQQIGKIPTEGKLYVIAKRLGQVGKEAIYPLPLRLKDAKSSIHQGHH